MPFFCETHVFFVSIPALMSSQAALALSLYDAPECLRWRKTKVSGRRSGWQGWERRWKEEEELGQSVSMSGWESRLVSTGEALKRL